MGETAVLGSESSFCLLPGEKKTWCFLAAATLCTAKFYVREKLLKLQLMNLVWSSICSREVSKIIFKLNLLCTHHTVISMYKYLIYLMQLFYFFPRYKFIYVPSCCKRDVRQFTKIIQENKIKIMKK